MPQNRNSSIVYTMVVCALLTALSVVFSRFAGIPVHIAGVYALRLSFGLVPVIFAGIAFGPGWGFLTGFLADMVGALLFPSGAYMPLFSFTYGFAGFLPPVLCATREEFMRWLSHPIHANLLPQDTSLKSYPRLLFAIGISQLINSVLLNSLIISLLYGRAFMALLPARLLTQLILIPVFAVLCRVLYALYRRAVPYRA